jgi:predicted dehydrogenase
MARVEGEKAMIRVGIIGYGYWGPHIARNFHAVDGCEVSVICDKSPAAQARILRAHPHVRATCDVSEVLCSPQIDAVAVITPVWTHFELAKTALENGKHVFVEKPFTSTTAQAEELIELAAKKNLKIMVDHTFLFTGAVKKIGQLIKDGTLGKLYYYDSTRVNLGLFQHDVNVIWDLAPHDLSIMDYLVQAKPEYLAATGQNHLNCHQDVAYITIYLSDNVIAHFNVNWLSPVKVRMTLLGGEKKMVVWNDLDSHEKLKVYDKGVEMKTGQGVYDLLAIYRSGDMWAPKIDQAEALSSEIKYFIDCVARDEEPFNDGFAGLRVVKLLEAADRSLADMGAAVRL